MTKRISILLSMLVLMLSTAAANAVITKWDLKIINETLSGVKFELDNTVADEPSYTFTVSANSNTTKSIKHGEYLVTYKACNLTTNYKGVKIDFEDADLWDDLGPNGDGDYLPTAGVDFTADMTIGSLTNDSEKDDNDITIILHHCEGQPIKTKVVFYSHLEDDVTVELTSLNEESKANKDYSLKASTGTNRFKDIWSGNYLYSYEACDETFSGQLYIEKSGDTQFVIRSCEYLTLEGYGQLIPQNSEEVKIDRQTPSNFTIANRSDQEFSITLVGPQTYLRKLQVGLNKYEIVPGSYQYICQVHDQVYRGTFSVPPTGAGSLTVPPATQEVKQLENTIN